MKLAPQQINQSIKPYLKQSMLLFFAKKYSSIGASSMVRLRNKKESTLHYGLGCDSSWLIWDYLTNPKSKFRKKYEINRVLISQVGLESKGVKKQVEKIIFPLLREAKIRTIQIARKSSSLRDGYVILEDTDSPVICHTRPTTEKPYYTLEDEMLWCATVPQYTRGKRYCSDKFKRKILDAYHDQNCPYCMKLIGFDSNERSRIEKAENDQQELHPTVYPLYEEGVSREFLVEGLTRETGRRFIRSACTICSFSFIAGSAKEIREKFDYNPYEGARAAYVEYVSICFNPRQSLSTTGKTMVERNLLNSAALELFKLELEEAVWKIYKVRRIRGLNIPYRHIQALAIGTKQEMERKFQELIRVTQGELRYCDHGIGRYYLPVRDEKCEEFIVVTPGSPSNDYKRPGFDTVWARKNGQFGEQIDLLN